MKKLLSFFLCMMLVFTLAACGGGDNNDELLDKIDKLEEKITELNEQLEDIGSNNDNDNAALISEIDKLQKDLSLLSKTNEPTKVTLTKNNWRNYLHISFQYEDSFYWQTPTLSDYATLTLKTTFSRKGNYHFTDTSISLFVNLGDWVNLDDTPLSRTVLISYDGYGETTYLKWYFNPNPSGIDFQPPDIRTANITVDSISGTVLV